MNKDTVKGKKSVAAASSQQSVPIAEIHDSTIVLKNGGIRAVLRTSSINFNLKSEPEQNSIIYSYQNFLNSLEYPIQILVRSKKLDIDDYLENVKSVGEKQTNPLIKRQTSEYVDYISKLVEYADIMDKEFYVVVPFDPPRAEKKGIFRQFWDHLHPEDTVLKIKQRHSEFDTLKKGLSQRLTTVRTGLEQIGLQVTELSTHELIELFYKIYNPGVSRDEKIEDLNEEELNKETIEK